MTGERILECFCGARVVADDAKQTLTHDGPECQQFQELLERNRRGYADAPPAPIPPDEDEEVALIVARNPSNTLIAAAEDFGLPASDPTTAARGVLREMRRRGWVVTFPNKT